MMTSSKPYLIRAIYEWIVDNGYTPYISVDTSSARVDVPEQYIKDNSITLDISPVAANQLLIDDEAITCKARFGGVLQSLYVPITSVIAIYAQENNEGMAFPPEEECQADLNETAYSNIETEETLATTTRNKFQFKVVTGGKNKDSISADDE